MRLVACMFALFITSVAEAQNTVPLQSSPCTRGASSLTVGGVRVDEMQCQMALQKEALAQAQDSLIVASAKILLLQSDLANALAAATKKTPVPASPLAK